MVRSMKLTLSLGALSSQHTFTTTIVKHHKDDCDLIVHYSKSRMKTLLELLPNQQQTIKDEEESQYVQSLDPAMTNMIC